MFDSDLVLDGVMAERGGRRVLHGIAARIPVGSVTALVGDNGSGKSTLVEVLAGALHYTGRIDGLPARRALVVQRTDAGERLPLTAWAAVAMGLWREGGVFGRLHGADSERIETALDTVGMAAVGRRQLGALSQGQRQRILVAQGLVQDVPLTLLDEPTASADSGTRDRIDTALCELAARGRTVVVATHDRVSLARADHALLLESGRVLAEGAPNDVAAEQARRAAAALALDPQGRST